MDGWCCYHESFEEDSIPDFLDVLIRNEQLSNRPPAAVGGDRGVIQTAVELEITSEDGVSETDVEFASGDDLEEDDGTLVGDLTDEPIEFPPDLDFDLTRELAFNETGSYELAVTVVDDESDEAVVALPFGIKSVDTGEDLEICEG